MSSDLNNVRFLTAAAGICSIAAAVCVIIPFFLASDALSGLLLLGFFVATFGAFFFIHKVSVAEQSVQKLPGGNGAA